MLTVGDAYTSALNFARVEEPLHRRLKVLPRIPRIVWVLKEDLGCEGSGLWSVGNMEVVGPALPEEVHETGIAGRMPDMGGHVGVPVLDQPEHAMFPDQLQAVTHPGIVRLGPRQNAPVLVIVIVRRLDRGQMRHRPKTVGPLRTPSLAAIVR